MTQAKLEYRTHVPYDVIAIKYCDLDFTGDGSSEHENAWHDIEFSDYRLYKELLDRVEEEIEDLNSRKITWWKLNELRNARRKISNLRNRAEKIKGKMFKDEYTLVREAHDYLIDNGFEKYHEYTKGLNSIVTVELWRKNEPHQK